MTRNMGTADRVIRTLLALAIGWLYFTDRITGILGLVLLAVAVMLLVTSAVGVCPGYWPFKFSTCKASTP